MRIRHATVVATIALLFAGSTQAALFDRGGGVIYDDDLNITWLQDANPLAYPRGGLVTWGEASSWAANFSYFDSIRNTVWDDWRLPSRPEEMRHLFVAELGGEVGYDLRYHHNGNYDLFQNIQPRQYWSASPYALNPDYMEVFNFYLGTEYALNKYNEFAHTWVVRDGDVMSAVPEPEAYALALAGLGVLALVAGRSKGIAG